MLTSYYPLEKKASYGYNGEMINKLRGQVLGEHNRALIIDVGGVGYRVSTTPATLAALKKSEGEVELWTHLVVREDALELYGFETQAELIFLELLITTPGVGPKSALAILAMAPPATLEKAILAGDTEYLTQVSGIGRKSAEKIILILKDKLPGLKLGHSDSPELKADVEVLEALKSLGYSLTEARAAVKIIPPGISGTNDRLKAVLQKLGQKK